MHTKREHRGPKIEPGIQPDELPQVKLDDIHIFSEVARYGSVRKAAHYMGRAHNQLSRRIDVLEHQTGKALFYRSNKGFSLTKDGKALFEQARDFIQSSKDVLGFIGKQKQGPATAAIGVTEGLGTFWLMPRLVDFRKKHPKIVIDFQCSMLPLDLNSREVDISVQVGMPLDDDVIVTRIGCMHVMLFTSIDYLNENGKPERLEDLLKFQFVEQVSPQIETTMLHQYFPDIPAGFISMKTNTSSSHANAVARGAGIGALPTYARALTKKLVPVCDEFHFRKEVYMTYLKETQYSSHHIAVVDWLRQSFDSQKYPWFAEEFIHPNEFESEIRDGNIVSMFDGFDYD